MSVCGLGSNKIEGWFGRTKQHRTLEFGACTGCSELVHLLWIWDKVTVVCMTFIFEISITSLLLLISKNCGDKFKHFYWRESEPKQRGERETLLNFVMRLSHRGKRCCSCLEEIGLFSFFSELETDLNNLDNTIKRSMIVDIEKNNFITTIYNWEHRKPLVCFPMIWNEPFFEQAWRQ